MKSKIRLIFQIFILALIIRVIFSGWDVEAFCPMGGILSLGTQLFQNTMACTMSAVAIFMALALFLGALAIGKLFCSYFCPIGLVTEWLGKLGKKLKLHFTLPIILDRIFRVLKYALLFIVLYYTITSSELFCKKFDPYYAAATGFGHDTVFWMSLTAIIITILGSIFVKQFWCKYICPLGAASNMFVNVYLVLIPFALYIAARMIIPELSVLWLLIPMLLLAYFWEARIFKFIPLPFMKITVDQNKCTHCSLCVKACPYGINVDDYEKVDHPDCMICTDCVHACRKEKAVNVNNSTKLIWLPVILAVLLPLMGFILSKNFEFRTLEKRWGKFEELSDVAKYNQSGIKNVKCYGTSLALYKKLKDKKGIYGLDTYAKSHSVNVYYDPNIISESKVKSAIFDPSRYKTHKFTDYRPDSLSVWQIGIENFFDRIDQMNLIRILNKNPHVFGFETNYGEPVFARFFFNNDSLETDVIRTMIDTTKRIVRNTRGKIRIYEMDFECEGEGRYLRKVTTEFYRKRMFGSYNQAFNGYSDKDFDALKIYEIGMPAAENFMVRRKLSYMVSHVSEDSGVVRFKTSFSDARPVAHIYFDPDIITQEKIYKYLMADTLRYFKSDDSRGTTPNIFEFELPSRILNANDFIDSVAEAKSLELAVTN